MTRYFAAGGGFGAIQSSLDEGTAWLTWCIPYFFNVPFDGSTSSQVWTPYLDRTRFNSIANNSTATVAVGVGPQNNSFGIFKAYPALLRSTTGSVYAWIDPRITSVNSDTVLASVSADTGLFIAVGSSPTDTPNMVILTSANGTTWTKRAHSGAGTVLGYDSISSIDQNYAVAVYASAALSVIIGSDASHASFALTSTDSGATWTTRTMAPATNTAFRSVHKNSTQFVAVGTNSATGAPVISTSPDGAAWTARTPAHGAGVLMSVFATDALIVAVGQNGTVPICETSTDGVTWTAHDPTFTSNLYTGYGGGWFRAVCYDSTRGWVAVGQYNPNNVAGRTFEPALVANFDGTATWTERVSSWIHPIYALTALTMVVPSSAATVYVYDDCCHLYTTQDLGVSWYMAAPNIETESDSFADMAMAITDADYLSMMTPDQNYPADPGPVLPPITDNAVIALTIDSGGANGVWKMIDYIPTMPAINFVQPGSGAISGHAQVIILGGAFFSDPDGNPGTQDIAISRDKGVTWTRTQGGLGPRNWITFCCASTASQIMYGASGSNPLSKSTDFGVTWFDLGASPVNGDSNGEFMKDAYRLRCSSNGQVVIYGVIDPTFKTSNLYISTNGGTSWTNPLTFTAASTNQMHSIDSALSMDGRVIMTLEAWGAANNIDGTSGAAKIHWSTDFGVTWSTKNIYLPATPSYGLNHFPESCNVSPDGTTLIVITGDYDFYYSTNSGATWSSSITTLSPVAFDINVAAFVVPGGPSAPVFPLPVGGSPPPPPPPRPGQGVYIERLANRILNNDILNSWTVDAGLGYGSPPIDTIAGGEHLAGKTVTGLQDGVVIPPFVMPASGIYTSSTGTFQKLSLGIGYTCDLQTLPLDVGDPSIQGKVKKIPSVNVRVAETQNLLIGADFNTLTTMKDLVPGQVSSTLTGQGNQIVGPLVSGDAMTVLNPTYTVPGQYCIRQDKPLPATILGVFPDVVQGDDR